LGGPDSSYEVVSLRSIRTLSPLPTPRSDCLDAFERELDYLFGTLQRLGARRADMDDLLQDIFVVLYRNWPTLDTTRTLRPWLFGVAFRVVRTHRRRAIRELPDESLDPEDSAPGPERWLQDHESLSLLTAALDLVPATRRSVIVMHDLEGLEVVDIAHQLSITKFGVYARLYKGRKELASAVRRLRRERIPT
jgi:RNA polymerase sigma-70 factor (ECF subfamily)